MGITTQTVEQHILMEADTSAATNVEMAICYHYNLSKVGGHNLRALILRAVAFK